MKKHEYCVHCGIIVTKSEHKSCKSLRLPLNSKGGAPYYIVTYVPVLIPVDTPFLPVPAAAQDPPEFNIWVHSLVENLKPYFYDDAFSHSYELFLYYFDICMQKMRIDSLSSQEIDKLKTVVFEKLSECVKFDDGSTFG